jgi:hypothetical protein
MARDAPSFLVAMEKPIACTLTAAGHAEQLERWHRLAARAFVAREETADGLRLEFRELPGVREELSALVAVEKECCAWASWEVDGAELRVRSTRDGVATLHGMLAL